MNIIKEFTCEYYLWVLTIAVMFIVAFFCILIASDGRKNRFLTWKKERINLGVYLREREYSKDDIMQELYDENIKLEKENKMLKKQASDSGLWGLVVLCVIIIALWVKRGKSNKEQQDGTSAEITTGTNDSPTLFGK